MHTNIHAVWTYLHFGVNHIDIKKCSVWKEEKKKPYFTVAAARTSLFFRPRWRPIFTLSSGDSNFRSACCFTQQNAYNVYSHSFWIGEFSDVDGTRMSRWFVVCFSVSLDSISRSVEVLSSKRELWVTLIGYPRFGCGEGNGSGLLTTEGVSEM